MSDDGSGDQSVSVGDAAEAASPAAAPSLGEVAAEDRAAAPAVPEASVEPVDDWVTELLDRLAAGDKLNASDAARVPYATQLQQQYFVAVQQQKSESAASQLAREAAKGQTELAREAAKGQTEILKQLAAVKRQSTDDLAAVRKELDEVRKGKEEDTEPAHREYVPRSKKNPFGGLSAAREDAAAEPALRFYNDEVAFKWIETKGGKDFYNFQALESTAEALFDLIDSIATLFPHVVEKINPKKVVDETSAEYQVELALCRVYNTVKATYDNVVNPQLSYLQLEAVLKKRHGTAKDSTWVTALLTALQRQLHGVVGTPLPENLAPKYQTVISDLEQRFSSQIAKQAAYTATRTDAGLPTRTPFQSKASGSFGSTVGSRTAARAAIGGAAGGLPRSG